MCPDETEPMTLSRLAIFSIKDKWIMDFATKASMLPKSRIWPYAFNSHPTQRLLCGAYELQARPSWTPLTVPISSSYLVSVSGLRSSGTSIQSPIYLYNIDGDRTKNRLGKRGGLSTTCHKRVAEATEKGLFLGHCSACIRCRAG